MNLKEWIQTTERYFLPSLALDQDPIGLHIGDPHQDIDTVYVALEASASLVEQVIEHKAQLLFVHHPLLFRPLKRVVESDPVQRLARTLIRNDIALYAAHTNVDLHPEGMANTWARRLRCSKATPAIPPVQPGRMKIITFVPETHTDSIRSALSKAGAGTIGDYEQCSFTTKGTGSFLGGETTNPFKGQSGTLEQIEEDRLEMVFPHGCKSRVLRALHESHPYDEVAYDLLPLEEFKDLGHAVWIAEFASPMSWEQFRATVESSLRVPPSWMQCTPHDKPVQRIAISTGSGNSMLGTVGGLGVDAYLTGELGYHMLWEANERGLNTLVVGHDASEAFFAETVIPPLRQRMPDLTWIAEHGPETLTNTQTEPR